MWRRNRETSPERNLVWTEPHNSRDKSSLGRVPVFYYLSRNGQLEHPHFMEVPLSFPDGLYLHDVINRLNILRGNGFAFMYSWSCKRRYKNGYVWHDLTDNDFIFPAHDQEYILKGSELVEGALMSKCDETVTSASFRKPPPECRKHDEDHDFPSTAGSRRRNPSRSSFDSREYKVCTGESTGIPAADTSALTEDKRRRRRSIREIEEEQEDKGRMEALGNHKSEVIVRDEISEISPPPSDSSPETLETLMKADGRIINEDPAVNISQLSGRAKASTVLMQLFSCGSIVFRDCGPGSGKRAAVCICPQENTRLPRGGGRNQVGRDAEDAKVSCLASGFGGRLKLEEKECFSGSLIQTKEEEFPALKRSTSCNAVWRSQMELTEKEEENEGGDRGNRKPLCKHWK